MAAVLSSNYKDNRTVGNESGKSMALVTRDLLGSGGGGDGSLKNELQELDLDLQVPNGWEKRLDLKSGKVYLQRCDSSNSSSPSSSDHKTQAMHQDLNFPKSPSSKRLLNLFDETSLELKLVSSSSGNFENICTLDKVKLALQRAEKEPVKKHFPFMNSPSSSSSFKETQEEDISGDNKMINYDLSLPVAAGCPGCLLYVLVPKNNPVCPRCNSAVPMPLVKKPRIDLNISM
ncbi:hypothetical protein ACFE04_023987 [Oxalis oulophora]